MVSTPTRGCAASNPGSSIRLEVMTGTRAAACSSFCSSTRKPQVVVMAAAPSRARPRTTAAKAGPTRPACKAVADCTTLSGQMPRTTRMRTGTV